MISFVLADYSIFSSIEGEEFTRLKPGEFISMLSILSLVQRFPSIKEEASDK
jgi:hypothetical protein